MNPAVIEWLAGILVSSGSLSSIVAAVLSGLKLRRKPADRTGVAVTFTDQHSGRTLNVNLERVDLNEVTARLGEFLKEPTDPESPTPDEPAPQQESDQAPD